MDLKSSRKEVTSEGVASVLKGGDNGKVPFECWRHCTYTYFVV